MKRCCFALSAVLALGASAVNADEPPPIKLTLTPAKLPTPALRYQLLPDARLTITGDAAPLYRQAIVLLEKSWSNEKSWQRLNSWAELPPDKLPKDEMRKVLAEFDNIYELLDKAARCDRCDWGLLRHLREKGVFDSVEKGESNPPSDVQKMRGCATLLGLRARLELASGRPEKAVATLRTGLALARRTGETETLISFLVGIGTAALMTGVLDEFIDRSDAPNLYNALTDLPAPLISMRKGMQGERVMMLGTFPGLAECAVDLDAGNMTAKQVEGCVKSLQKFHHDKQYDYSDRKKLVQLIQEKHEVAKKALIAAGRPREKVEAMPHVQVALLHGLLEYDTLFEQTVVWHDLPYWETATRYKDLDESNRREREKDPNAPALALARLLFPANEKAAFARVRTDRKIAMLRCVEAVRFYAASHDGKLPASLSAIKEVAVPTDPVTGKDFEYHLDGEVATLRGPAPSNDANNVWKTVTYELRIRK
jgi:hypothetical protein